MPSTSTKDFGGGCAHSDFRTVKLALIAITPGSAARLLAQGHPPLKFIEQVEYNGRRLAKMNLPPTAILDALKEYDKLFRALVERDVRRNRQSLRWIREQLHFCVILTLNNAYYQVREAETQAFYDQFRIELEARSLDELLERLLESLVRTCRADAGCFYWAGGADGRLLSCALGGCGEEAGHKNRWPAPPGLPEALRKPHCRDLRREHFWACLLDPSWKDRFITCWSMPIAAKGRLAGVLQFGFEKEYEWLPHERDLLAAAAERCLMAAEKQRLVEDLAQREEQVRRLAGHMLHMEEVERRRISRELHDEADKVCCVFAFKWRYSSRSFQAG
jgi:hypothetical protein